MMQNIRTALLLLSFLPVHFSFAQEHKPEYVLGWTAPDSLYRVAPEFCPTPGLYQPAENALRLLRRYDEPLTILIFFGSWCSDSKSQLPVFFNTAGHVANKNFTLKLFGLDRSKKEATGFAEAFGVSHVPTFIFLRGQREFSANGQAPNELTLGELGRITEKPALSIEQDWINILQQNAEWTQRMEWERQILLLSLSIALFITN